MRTSNPTSPCGIEEGQVSRARGSLALSGSSDLEKGGMCRRGPDMRMKAVAEKASPLLPEAPAPSHSRPLITVSCSGRLEP